MSNNKQIKNKYAKNFISTSAPDLTIQKLPLVVVLDNIRSTYNVGAAFRIADAFLLERIYLCGITAQPPHRGIHKTALGAEDAVAWTYAPDTLTLLAQLRTLGYAVAAVEQTAHSIPLQEYQPPRQPHGLVFGNEVSGIGPATLAACDVALKIPQYGVKDSLNVAVCIGITTWEFTKFTMK